jgi:hypothetical protein
VVDAQRWGWANSMPASKLKGPLQSSCGVGDPGGSAEVTGRQLVAGGGLSRRPSRWRLLARAQRYLICLSNVGYAASLEPRKVYVALRDEDASQRGLVRVIDESGEDYLFPASSFAAIDLPEAAQRVFRARASDAP